MVLFGGLPSLLWGQTGNGFVRFSTAEGLPSNNVGVLAEDADGFLWVGTSSGIARFDGRRFAAFRNLCPETLLPEEPVGALCIDRQGFMWVKFAKTLFRVSLATYQTWSYEQNLTPACEDEAGHIYLSGAEGLALFREQQGDFQYFPLVQQGKNLGVDKACMGKNGQMVLHSDGGMFRFDTQKQVYERLNALGEAAKNVYSMASDAEGMVWLSVWYHPEMGFMRYDPYQDKVLRVFNGDERGISSTDLNNIYPDGDNVWMATNSGGLCRYLIREDRFECIKANAMVPGSLWSNQLAVVRKDRYGNLWVGTPFFLFLKPAQHTDTELLTHDPYQPNSLIAPQGAALLSLSDRLLVFGTLAGLSIFDREKHAFLNVRLPTYNNNDYNNQFICMAKAEGGGFWAATWSGLYRLDPQNGRTLEYYITHANAGEKHPEAVKRFALGATRRMCKDRAGVLWRVSFTNRVARLDERRPERVFEQVDTLVADDNPLNDRVESFLDYDERYFLLGTLDGLVRYDRTTKRFETCPASFPGLTPPIKIWSLARTQQGAVLLIANGKPFRVNLNAPGALATRLPLPNEVFQGQHILADAYGSYWVTTENGVVRIDEATGFCWLYDSRHFLNDNMFLLRPSVAPTQDADGHLYFGGSRGVSILDPLQFKSRTTSPPPVKIVALYLNDRPAVLDTTIHHARSIRLAYYQNDLSFEFAALYSAVPARNRFAYRLNGGTWVDLGTQNAVNFNRLAPGTYTLQVKAANSDGVWNEEGVRLRITILPPWWRSWPAYLVYLVLLGLGLRRYLRFREHRLQMAYQLEAERREAERLQELDAFKSRFFTNITHEFRTPLAVILGMSEQMETAAPAAKSGFTPIQLIRRNAQNLLRLINQLLDLAKLESNVLQLNNINGDVLGYVRYIAESLHSFAHIRKVRVRVASEETDINMDYDPERLLQIAHNLLSNAIKFTPKGGQVTLFVGKAAPTEVVQTGAHAAASVPTSMLVLSVTDTGAGIPPEDLPYIFDRFYQAKNQAHNKAGGTGIGLALTQELVKLMGGSIVAESMPGKGSIFTIKLPITQTAFPGWEGATPIVPAMAPDSLEEDAPVPLAPSAPSGPRMLLIEDNPDVVEYLRLCLAGEYEVAVAYNGQAGIEQALNLVPDLIVSDVMMPEKDGFEVCDFLKNDARTSHIPIVLLTARATVEDRIAGLRRGADAYLAKPFHREEFLVTVANLLQSRRILQQRLRSALLSEQPAPEAPANTVAPEVLSALEIEDVFVQKMRRYVEEQMGNTELSMDELSRAMTMSYTNLHRKLTALTNLSPVQFIRVIRLQKAKTLLQTTRLSIGDIAFEVGFGDPKYFSRVFTEEFGKPPSAFREAVGP